jgi:pyruvate kinase
MMVTSIKGENATLEAQDDGRLRDRSRINIPGKFLPIGSVTDRDIEFLAESVKQKVEFFALSFVQGKDNVIELEEKIREHGGDQFIVSKIETKSGLQNIREITRVSDFIMVAR